MTTTKTIELDGTFNTIADALALRANEVGGLYLAGRYVDVIPSGDCLVVVCETRKVASFSRSFLGFIAGESLVPFVYRSLELAGLLEIV